MSSVHFRPLVEEDFARLHLWFNAPHAQRWFGRRMGTLEDVAAEYRPTIAGTVKIRAYVVELEGRPIGLCEWCRAGDFPDMQRAYGIEDPNAANCDILLGEPDVAHRGFGVGVIRSFLERIVFADPRITSCVIDPETDNAIAIRAYEKVGFRFVRSAADDLDDASVYLMELARGDLGRADEGSGVAFVIRPMREGELPVARAIDADAATAFATVGLPLEFPGEHALVQNELRRWQASAADGYAFLACSADDGEPVGFAALGRVDDVPYIHQVSVRRAWMRRGIGTALVQRAQRWSVRAQQLWLTTYDHVPWNAPFYERLGFVRAADAECGVGMRALLGHYREWLPQGEHEVAMVYRHPARFQL